VSLESIAVTPTDPSIVLGTKQQFSALGRYSDGSEMDLTAQAQWTSSAPNVATVSDEPGSDGLATSVTVGRATIKATDLSSGVFGESDLDVIGDTTNRAYVANSGGSSVSVIDIEDGVVIDTITVNTGPWAVAVHPTANLAYVTHNTLDSVSVIDVDSDVVTDTIPIPAGHGTLLSRALALGKVSLNSEPFCIRVQLTGYTPIYVALRRRASLGSCRPRNSRSSQTRASCLRAGPLRPNLFVATAAEAIG
jgi:YVTN family beta-propeller protein